MNDASTDTRDIPTGAGLGLRRGLMQALWERQPGEVDFLEVAPENWIGVGGRQGRRFREFTERYPVTLHGLSLSLGAPSPLDEELLGRIRRFMDRHGITFYSEHLSYCGDDGHLYDLMPIPFTEEAVHYVAGRIRRAQDILGQRIAVENVSYYAMPDRSLSEQEFLRAVLEEADCDLLLDVNNIVVNAINHGYDAGEFLEAMPAERVAYLHVAGHYVEAEDLRVDTHGAAVSDPVWQLLARTYERLGPLPTLLERDFNFPPLDELLGEVRLVRRLQQDPAALSRAETEAVHG
ncbi:MAG: DUF692 family protein [Gammaproteobacteria bacterium]|jgi:uncharacterized protein (UPF0276 family)|nr:DUF692 family protein [Gammaproteobacteria bacterium]